MNEEYTDPNANNLFSSDNITADEYGTFFRYVETEKLYFTHLYDEENTYQLVVNFPSEYKDAKYQDIYELLEIKVDSKQIIDEN